MSLFSMGMGGGLNLLSMASGNAKAVLVPESFGLPVMFSFNPQKVKKDKKVKTEGNRGMVKTAFDNAAQADGNVRLKLSNAHLTGIGYTLASCEQLIEWNTPISSMGILGQAMNLGSQVLNGGLSMGNMLQNSQSQTRRPNILNWGGVNDKLELPVLLFMWGVGGVSGLAGMKVTLEEVSISYKRFDFTGMPIWAEVDLTLVEYNAPLFSQNPTSGSVPGRRKHTVMEGDSVVRIAQQNYGTPNAWRAVAEANRLDDPLRVKPGRQLALPAPAELEQEVA
jgi:LysM domain